MNEPLRSGAKMVFRVHVDGMNPTETKIFAGMIHLAERNDTVFQLEADLARSDIFIFDGAKPSAIEFAKSHAHLAQSTIWINPPVSLLSPRHIRRPIPWSALLAMMEQMVGPDHAQSAALQNQPDVNVSFDRFCDLAEEILSQHIGVAAGFVVEDVRAEGSHLAGSVEAVTTDVLLAILKRQLPTNVNADTVIREILSASSPGGHG